MKCVKYRNGRVDRVKDRIARDLVEKGGGIAQYCPKWEWKDQEGKEYKGVRDES